MLTQHKTKNGDGGGDGLRPDTPTDNDTITFGQYDASMTSGEQQISASSSLGNPVTLTADGEGMDEA
jgi:hypothetical protein